MLNKGILLSALLCLVFCAAIAQPETELKPIGDTGEAEAAARAEYLTNLHNYNAEVNKQMALNQLYHHHIDINRTNKTLGTTVTTQGIDVFFDLRGEEVAIKKIMVLSTTSGQTSSYEYLFDAAGELNYYSYRENIMNPKSTSKAYYFTNKQMVYYSENGLVKPKADYGAELFNQGVEIINESLEYKGMLLALARVHPKN